MKALRTKEARPEGPFGLARDGREPSGESGVREELRWVAVRGEVSAGGSGGRGRPGSLGDRRREGRGCDDLRIDGAAVRRVAESAKVAFFLIAGNPGRIRGGHFSQGAFCMRVGPVRPGQMLEGGERQRHGKDEGQLPQKAAGCSALPGSAMLALATLVHGSSIVGRAGSPLDPDQPAAIFREGR